MKINYKSILVVSLIVLSILGSFACGIWYSAGITAKLFSPSYTKEVYSRVISKQIALEQIDKNNIEQGHDLIKSELRGDILTLDTLYESEIDEEMKIKIKGFLHRIAKHREQFPHYYSANKNKNPELKEVYSMEREILGKYL